MSSNIDNLGPEYEDLVGWKDFHPDDLWVLDKLILSTKLGYKCGPRGLPVPNPSNYIIRPIMNLMGMGDGAKFIYIEKDTAKVVPNGFFWCEKFEGKHLSIDYVDGKQVLCLEGLKMPGDPIWKWKEWRKSSECVPFPSILLPVKSRYRHFNIEMIGDKIIEVHIRLNPNWRHGDYESALPVFWGDDVECPPGYTYVEDSNEYRRGFFFK